MPKKDIVEDVAIERSGCVSCVCVRGRWTWMRLNWCVAGCWRAEVELLVDDVARALRGSLGCGWGRALCVGLDGLDGGGRNEQAGLSFIGPCI
jgi:hypothetical protein